MSQDNARGCLHRRSWTPEEIRTYVGSDVPHLTRLYAIAEDDPDNIGPPLVCENCAPIIPLRPAVAPRTAEDTSSALVRRRTSTTWRNLSDDEFGDVVDRATAMLRSGSLTPEQQRFVDAVDREVARRRLSVVQS